jgi:hypothetical protein
MGNRRSYKIERFHAPGTPASERLKVTALPSPTYLRPPKRGLRVGGSGYAQAGLNLFHPTASPPFPKNRFLHIATQSPGGEGFRWEDCLDVTEG